MQFRNRPPRSSVRNMINDGANASLRKENVSRNSFFNASKTTTESIFRAQRRCYERPLRGVAASKSLLPLHVLRQPTPWSLRASFAERLKDVLLSLLP